MSLKEQLKTAEACRDYHRDALMEAQKHLNGVEDEIKEAEKPKLRHGDCNIANNAIVGTHNNSTSELVWTDEDGYVTGLRGPRAVDFNAHDDLKALQEDLMEFEIPCDTDGDEPIEAGYFPDGYFCVRSEGDYRLTPKQLDKFILKLRQMRATAKRNK